MCVVCMRNNYRHRSSCCFPINEISRFRTMPMDNPILRMLIEKVGNLFPVCTEGEWMEGDHTVDLATHCLYFIIVHTLFLPVYHEIELNPVAVYVTVVVHDHRLSTSPVHDGEKHQYSDWSFHCNIYFIRFPVSRCIHWLSLFIHWLRLIHVWLYQWIEYVFSVRCNCPSM